LSINTNADFVARVLAKINKYPRAITAYSSNEKGKTHAENAKGSPLLTVVGLKQKNSKTSYPC